MFRPVDLGRLRVRPQPSARDSFPLITCGFLQRRTNHLVTHFESVSAFLSYPAPGYPGRDPPLESYLSQRRLWGGRGTSRVRLPYTGAISMALKPHFPSLYHYPGLLGPEAFTRRRSLHGLSYPWVSGNRAVTALT